MAKNYVYGSFDTVNEAVDAADLLEKRGVPESNIAIVGDNTHESSYGADYEFVTYTELEEEEERGWFDKLFNPTPDVDLDFSDYQSALRDGKVLVVIDEDYRSDYGYYGGADNPFAAGTAADAARRSEGDPVLPTDHHADEIVEPEFGGRVRGPKEPNQDSAAHLEGERETIELHEEEVDVHTRKRDLGNVEISKETVEETKTVEVPVEHEELHIKHKKPTGDKRVDGNQVFEEETIEVPLSEDEIVVDKETRVTDEVEIEKTTHTDTQSVSETERREELIIDDETGRLEEDSNRPDNKG